MISKNKRGLSPVIATILLVGIVITIGVIVFLWFQGITKEAITKFGGTNIKIVCEDVSFDAQYSGGNIFIENTGTVPIYKIKAKIAGEGSYSTIILNSSWPDTGLTQGMAYSGPIEIAKEVLLIPVLVGTSDEGDKAHTCEERHGLQLTI